jgi:hypothetical protein
MSTALAQGKDQATHLIAEARVAAIGLLALENIILGAPQAID